MEFATMPFGTQNFMLDFDRNGILLGIRNALTDANFARIVVGMDHEDVRRVLGNPAHTIRFPLKHEEVWDWKTGDDAGETTFFNVHFDDDGQVCATSRHREPRG
ncbi:outer membrane protein assembly factor BamE domain-containing protein [Propionivibrio dicarboxylicus]|uniref:SmpA / OmlA family protein n=1 Tax=Propionivibrio dicarboxylicus TaxID=83767 RepID=A0A1G7VU95_9RHOO|nr:outer membrane protein assembly factor BamE [Propionivibrio dicarboxylicus]SDG62470.1 SmpA / OmlA family protein [Propionivibrio dicarboxylicus]